MSTSADAQRLPSLDGLRALSICLVLAGHAFAQASPRPWSDLAIAGSAVGVLIFFVISGFLITHLLCGERDGSGSVSLGAFYLRRALRLAPPLIAYLVVIAVAAGLHLVSMSSCQWVADLTYTRNYACAGDIDGHLWSLSVEEQFYLFWPLLLLLSGRRVGWWAVGVALLGPLSRLIQYERHDQHFFWLSSQADVLMIGCLTALAVRRWPVLVSVLVRWRMPSRGLAIALILLPEVLRAHLLLGWYTVMFGATTQAIGTALLLCSCVYDRSGALFRFLNTSAATWLGRASYSVYIWQQPMFLAPISSFFAPLWGIGLAICSGAASFYAIERPAARLKGILLPWLAAYRPIISQKVPP